MGGEHTTYTPLDPGYDTWKWCYPPPKAFLAYFGSIKPTSIVAKLGSESLCRDTTADPNAGMIAQTLITMQDLPFVIKHAVLGATCAKNPKSDLGKAMAGYLREVQAAGKKPEPRAMSEVMTKVSRPSVPFLAFRQF